MRFSTRKRQPFIHFVQFITDSFFSIQFISWVVMYINNKIHYICTVVTVLTIANTKVT